MNSTMSRNVVQTALDKVFFGKFNYETLPGIATARTAGVFMQDTTDRAAVIVEQYQGPGYFEARSEEQDVAGKSPRAGNPKTFSVVNYAESVDIPKNFFDDEQFSVVERTVARMGRNGRLSQDKNAFEVFNNGFTTVTTNDGAPLFSNTHTTLGGDTVDNLLTDELDDSALEAAVVALTEQLTQDGTLGGFMPACLLVPPALFAEANKIAKSELQSGTANNDLNYFSTVYPGLQVMQSPFLGASQGGSDKAWFLLSPEHSIMRWVRQDIETDLVGYKTQRNNNYIYKAEYREVVGAISYEGAVASNGTT